MINVHGSTRRTLFVSLVLAVVLLTLFRWTRLNAEYLRNIPIDSPIRPPAQNPSHPSPKPPPSSNPNPEPETKPGSNDLRTKEAWIKAAVDTELAGPIKHAPIQSVCASSKWQDDLVFTCDHIAGGIGNVRNHLLNCIRYSIEGGGSLVMPGIMRRKAEDISEIYTDEWQDLSYLLDKPWFAEQLAVGCPELKVWDKLEDVPGYNDGKVTATVNLLPGSLDNWVPKTGLAHPEFWRGWFDKWLVEYVGNKPEGSTTHVGLGRAYLEYPVHHDGEDFVREFGKIIRLREDARNISATVLWELKEKFFKDGGIDPEKEVNEGAFFGVHLRTEADAVKAWPAGDWKYQRYDVQAELSIEEIKNSNLTVVYVASGNVTEVERLESDLHTALNTTSISVVTKHDLLTGDDKKMLESMTFDQQALVDLLIMEKASKFVGIGHSSFAWNVALKRHLLIPKEKEFLDGQFMLSDSLSQIFGVPRAYPEYASCMWP